jgi:ATP-dependent RNA helicase RhlE
VLAAFRQGAVRILVATDIAARGIDVDGISHVVNYDLPNEPESYVHRIGRTARAGAAGVAVSLCDNDEVPYLRAIEKLIRTRVPATDRRFAQAHGLAPAEPQERRANQPRRSSHKQERHPEERHSKARHPQNGRSAPQHSRAATGRGAPSAPAPSRPAHKSHNGAHERPANSQPAHVKDEPKDLSGVAFLHRGWEPRRNPQHRPQR